MVRTIVAIGVAATLLVTLALPRAAHAAPANDAFSASLNAGALPYANVQDTTTATLEASEPQPPPACATVPVGKTVWYSFTAPSNGLYQVDTLGSSFDTILSVFTGNAVNGLSLVGCNDETTSGIQSRLLFSATSGVTYRVQVGGFDGEAGLAQTNISLVPPPPANDNFAAAQTVGAVPYTDSRFTHMATFESGEPAQCGAIGKTVWYRFVAGSTSQFQIDTIGSNFDTILTVFSGNALNALSKVVCNDDIAFPTRTSKVSLNAISGTTYYVQVGGFAPGELDTDFGNLMLHVKGNTQDSDGDGCTDAEESLLNLPIHGGDRDPNNPWDFFDVTGDRAIDVNDVVLILNHFGHGPNSDPTDNLLDRWSPDPSKLYRTAEAPGQYAGVDVMDAVVSLQSFGHNCDGNPG